MKPALGAIVYPAQDLPSIWKGRIQANFLFLRCFVNQTCYNEMLSGNVTKCDAHVGHGEERGKASNAWLSVVREMLRNARQNLRIQASNA